MPVNVFPPRLREAVDVDEYLMRVQTSLAHKARQWNRRGYSDSRYVALALRARIIEVRKALRGEVEKLALGIPIVHSATGVKGLQIMAFLRLATRIDINRADTPAKLWRYCGLGLSNGTPDTIYTILVPGRVSFSTRARTAVAQMRRTLISAGKPYRAVMDEYMERQKKRGINNVRAGQRGWRYAMKLWLKHLWLVWRRQEKLPVGKGHANDTTRLAAPYGWR